MKRELVGLEGQTLPDEVPEPSQKLALGLGALRDDDTVVVHQALVVPGFLSSPSMGRSLLKRRILWLRGDDFGDGLRPYLCIVWTPACPARG